MKILILGKAESRAAWESAFRESPENKVRGCDPAEGLTGYKEREVVSRFEAAAMESKPDAVCVAAERKYHGCLALKSAELGLHTLVVPPLGDTAEERSAAVAAAADSGVSLMLACHLVFRPGILRLISLIYQGLIGAIKSVVFETNDLNDFISDLEKIGFDAAAYHHGFRLWCDRVCLALKILKRDSVSAPDSFTFTRDSHIETIIGGKSAEVRFVSRNAIKYVVYDPALPGGADAVDSETAFDRVLANNPIADKLTVVGESGTLICYKTLAGEALDIEIGGRRKCAVLAGVVSHPAAASYFADFVSKGIQPFVDGRSALSAESCAQEIMSMFQRRGMRAIVEKPRADLIPPYLTGLDKTGESTVGDIYIFSRERYEETFDWKTEREFGLLLLAAPCAEAADDYRNKTFFPPLSISVLGAVAERHGCRVQLDSLSRFALEPGVLSPDEIDLVWPARPECADPLYRKTILAAGQKIAAALRPASRDLIGISLTQESHSELLASVCEGIKALSGARIVFGGAINFITPQIEKYADFIVSGEGEIPLLALIRHLTDGWPPEYIPGLVKPQLSGFSLPEIITDVRIRGVPLYEPALMNLHLRGGEPIFPFIFISGCPHKCIFCANHMPYGKRILEPDDAVSKIAAIKHKYGARRFYFLNHLVNHSEGYMHRFLDCLIAADLNIAWSDCACLYGLDKTVLDKMKASGCERITWGLDTGSQRLAKLNHKPVVIADAERILRLSFDAGISNNLNLITGLPHETPDDFRKTIDFLDRNKKLISLVYHLPCVFAFTSPMFRNPDKYGIIKKGDSFDEPGGLKWEARIEQTASHSAVMEKYLSDNRDFFPAYEWETA